MTSPYAVPVTSPSFTTTSTNVTLIDNATVSSIPNSTLTGEDTAAQWSGMVGLCVGAWLTGLFIVGGNLLTVLAVVRVPRLRTFSNLYIASLAVADCLVGILLPVLGLSFLPSFQHWFRGSYAGCMTFLGLIYVSAFCSGTHLWLVAVDRYLFIVKPFLYIRVVNERTVRGSITLAWSLSFLYGCCVFVFNDYENVRNCNGHEVLHPGYTVYLSGGLHFAMSFITAFLYGRIVRLAVKKQGCARRPPTVVNQRHSRIGDWLYPLPPLASSRGGDELSMST